MQVCWNMYVSEGRGLPDKIIRASAKGACTQLYNDKDAGDNSCDTSTHDQSSGALIANV